MSALVVAALAVAAAATALLWRIAVRAAIARSVELGAVPLGWLCASAAVTAAVMLLAGPVAGVATVAICVAAIIDSRCGYIFDPLSATGLIATWSVAGACGTLGEAMFGAAATAGSLLAIHLATAGRGLGLGDVKLGALPGAGLGMQGGAAAMGVAFVIGAAAALGALSTGKSRVGDAVRFGPYLAAGTLLVLAYQRVNTGVIR